MSTSKKPVSLQEQGTNGSAYIAVVRVRGKIGVARHVNDTLHLMHLYRQNGCVIVPNNPVYLGMIRRAKDYITWGEIDIDTFIELIKKRGRLAGNKQLTIEYIKEKLNVDVETLVKEVWSCKRKLRDIPGLKPFFRLKPPQKGFEREGIKKPFSMGGALGYRKEKINELIRRMM